MTLTELRHEYNEVDHVDIVITTAIGIYTYTYVVPTSELWDSKKRIAKDIEDLTEAGEVAVMNLYCKMRRVLKDLKAL